MSCDGVKAGRSGGDDDDDDDDGGCRKGPTTMPYTSSPRGCNAAVYAARRHTWTSRVRRGVSSSSKRESNHLAISLSTLLPARVTMQAAHCGRGGRGGGECRGRPLDEPLSASSTSAPGAGTGAVVPVVVSTSTSTPTPPVPLTASAPPPSSPSPSPRPVAAALYVSSALPGEPQRPSEGDGGGGGGGPRGVDTVWAWSPTPIVLPGATVDMAMKQGVMDVNVGASSAFTRLYAVSRVPAHATFDAGAYTDDAAVARHDQNGLVEWLWTNRPWNMSPSTSISSQATTTTTPTVSQQCKCSWTWSWAEYTPTLPGTPAAAVPWVVLTLWCHAAQCPETGRALPDVPLLVMRPFGRGDTRLPAPSTIAREGIRCDGAPVVTCSGTLRTRYTVGIANVRAHPGTVTDDQRTFTRVLVRRRQTGGRKQPRPPRLSDDDDDDAMAPPTPIDARASVHTDADTDTGMGAECGT